MEELSFTSDFPATAPNASLLPYAVQYRGWGRAWRMLGTGCGAVLVTLGAYVIARSPPSLAKAPLVISNVAVALFFVLQLWRLTKSQVILYPDRLEKLGLFRSLILHRENVKGVGKTIYTRYGSYFEIASKSAGEPSVRLDGALRKDPVVAEWLRGAKDPKAEALKAERAEILADVRYGATEGERARRLEWTKQWTTALNIACLMLAAWIGFLAPLSSTTLFAALAPLAVAAALVQMSSGLVVWLGRPGRPRITAALAPAAALAAHAGLTTHMLRPEPLGWLALFVGFGIAAQRYTTQIIDPTRLRSAIVVGVVAGLVAYGLGVALDVCLDGSRPKTFVATVTDERISHGRATSYYLDLSPWSDQPSSEVSISSAFYEGTPVGSRVCLARRTGSLGLGWFDVTHCRLLASTVQSARDGTPALPPGTASPDWITAPNGDDLAALYPDRAQRMEVEGAATIRCTVEVDGSLADCRVISESPPGYGFGAATLKAATRFRMRPATHDGRAVLSSVNIPLNWRLR